MIVECVMRKVNNVVYNYYNYIVSRGNIMTCGVVYKRNNNYYYIIIMNSYLHIIIIRT